MSLTLFLYLFPNTSLIAVCHFFSPYVSDYSLFLTQSLVAESPFPTLLPLPLPPLCLTHFPLFRSSSFLSPSHWYLCWKQPHGSFLVLIHQKHACAPTTACIITAAKLQCIPHSRPYFKISLTVVLSQNVWEHWGLFGQPLDFQFNFSL